MAPQHDLCGLSSSNKWTHLFCQETYAVIHVKVACEIIRTPLLLAIPRGVEHTWSEKEQQKALSLPHCKSCMITSGVEGTGQLFGSLNREFSKFKALSWPKSPVLQKHCDLYLLSIPNVWSNKTCNLFSGLVQTHTTDIWNIVHQHYTKTSSPKTHLSQKHLTKCTKIWPHRVPFFAVHLRQRLHGEVGRRSAPQVFCRAWQRRFFLSSWKPGRKEEEIMGKHVYMKVSSFYGCETNSKMRLFWSIGVKIKHVFET